MKVLFLGPPSKTLHFLKHEVETEHSQGPCPINAELIVSHDYRYLLPVDVIETIPCVNLHIGFLPWNRGAHPNYWAIREGTPSGCTVHWMDAGIDTGPIIAQRRIEPRGTLRTSYRRLQKEVTDLFVEFWPLIRDGKVLSVPQEGEGTVHTASQLPENIDWDAPVESFTGAPC